MTSLSISKFLPEFSLSAYWYGITQFIRPAPVFRDAEWFHAVDHYFSQIGVYAPTIPFDEAVRRASEGGWATGHWSRYAPQTGLKSEALSNPLCLKEIRRRLRSYDFSAYTFSLKDEMAKRGRFPRLFTPVGLDVLVASWMVYGAWIDRFQVHSRYGVCYTEKNDAGFVQRMGARLQGHVTSTDVSGADTSICCRLKAAVYYRRDECVHTSSADIFDTIEEYDYFRKALVSYLIEPKVNAPISPHARSTHGLMLQLEGNLSGSLLTLLDNSIIFRCLHLVASFRVGLHPEVFVTGDDSIWAFEDDEESLAYLNAYKKVAADYGFRHDEFLDGKKAEFCGFHIRKLGEYYVRVPIGRVADALLYNFCESDDQMCSAVNSLIIDYYFHPDRSYLTLYRSVLSERHEYAWSSDRDIRGLLLPPVIHAEAFLQGKSPFSAFKRELTMNATQSKSAKARARRAAKKAGAIPPAKAASTIGNQRLTAKAADGLPSLAAAYAAFLRDPSVKLGGPATGARYAEVRTVRSSTNRSVSSGGASVNYWAIFDLLAARIFLLKQVVGTDLCPKVAGELSWDDVISFNEYADQRVSSAVIKMANNTLDAGTGKITGHFSAGQFAALDDLCTDLDEIELRARAVPGSWRETDDVSTPASCWMIPSESSFVARPVPGNQAQDLGADHRLFYGVVVEADGFACFADGARAANDHVFIADYLGGFGTPTANGYHHLPLRYSGPVDINMAIGMTLGTAGAATFRCEVSRLQPDGSIVVDVADVLTTLSSAYANTTGVVNQVQFRSVGSGLITRIDIDTINAMTVSSTGGGVELVMHGGGDMMSDTLIVAAYGIADGQECKVSYDACLDLTPGPARRLEQPPVCLPLPQHVASDVAIQLARERSMAAHALSLGDILRGVSKIGGFAGKLPPLGAINPTLGAVQGGLMTAGKLAESFRG